MKGFNHIGHKHLHLKWSKSIPAVLVVADGEVVEFDVQDCTSGQLHPNSTAEDVRNLKLDLCDPVFGPVAIEGAEVGDVLEVEFLHLQPGEWGFTCIIPGFGLLADEFLEPAIHHYHILPEDTHIMFDEKIKVPIRPFLGCCGIAPALPGEFSTIPPLDSGGNLDCRHLTAGVKLFLPINTPGALFSCGDGHVAQGDGEVCGTAIETSMKATIRFKVRKDMPYVTSPHYDTQGQLEWTGIDPKFLQNASPAAIQCNDVENRGTKSEDKGNYAAIGIDSDLREACRKAVRGILGYLVAERQLTRSKAYMLASIAADLKIVEAVDMPNYAVACSIPLDIFNN